MASTQQTRFFWDYIYFLFHSYLILMVSRIFFVVYVLALRVLFFNVLLLDLLQVDLFLMSLQDAVRFYPLKSLLDEIKVLIFRLKILAIYIK